jgi:hypothetical protein
MSHVTVQSSDYSEQGLLHETLINSSTLVCVATGQKDTAIFETET